jgi:hypothetical protein
MCSKRRVATVASSRLRVRIERDRRRGLGRFDRSYYKVSLDASGKPQIQLIKDPAYFGPADAAKGKTDE